MDRRDGRGEGEARALELRCGALLHAEGSCEVICGRTRVLCSASLTKPLPRWQQGRGSGWLTAQYGMLPRATSQRVDRDISRGGRAQEISRLVGRSLRAAVDLERLGERMITIDCDVLDADGGTRTASVTGGWAALRMCVLGLLASGELGEDPMEGQVAGTSCGLVGGKVLCDLTQEEDAAASVDANFVMTSGGGLVEVQATGEKGSYDLADLLEMERAARAALEGVFRVQREATGRVGEDLWNEVGVWGEGFAGDGECGEDKGDEGVGGGLGGEVGGGVEGG